MITQEIKDELTANGCNYAALAGRFMNMDKLAEKFLKKFPADESINLMKEAIDALDTQKLFTSAHTLKGLCGNLCMEGILEILDPLVENARAGSADGATQAYEEIRKRYDTVCAIIAKIE